MTDIRLALAIWLFRVALTILPSRCTHTIEAFAPLIEGVRADIYALRGRR